MPSEYAEPPVRGKTFSLFGGANSAEAYFPAVAAVADEGLRLCPDPAALLAILERLGRRRFFRKGPRTEPVLQNLASRMEAALAPFLTDVEGHLRGLPLRSRLRSALATRREAYLAIMVEVELMNRLHAAAFRRCARKLAFLPHCLRDLTKECKAGREGLDWVCRGCSKVCGVRVASDALRAAGVEPYLWMEADLKKLLHALSRGEASVGVLGIACLPELVQGMRLCHRRGVPVVGVPLNANRCARWMGTLHETSFHLDALRRLLEEEGRRMAGPSL